jgi:hypothetical protein
MKRWLVAFVFFAAMVCGSQSAFAGMPIKQAGNFGIGLGVGTTAAPISGKYFLDSTLSIQGNVGWWRGWWGGCGRYNRRNNRYDYCGGYTRDALGLGADLLYEGGTLAGNESVTLDWEIGGGAGIGVGNRTFGLAAAFVAGLQLNIHALPIDLVLEYRPGLYLVPYFAFSWFDFTGHVRYYF